MNLLATLKISCVLDRILQPFLEANDEDTDNIKANRKKPEENELVHRGQILSTLSHLLYNLFTSIQHSSEIKKALEFKCNREKHGANKFYDDKVFELLWLIIHL